MLWDFGVFAGFLHVARQRAALGPIFQNTLLEPMVAPVLPAKFYG